MLAGEGEQFCPVDVRTCRRHDDGTDLLAHHGVGDAHHGDLADRWMTVERVLDLHAIHVLATPVDHVFHPVDDEDQAIVIQPGQVAGVQPPIHECLSRLFGFVPVAGHDVRAAHEKLPDPSRAVGLINPQIDDGRGEADRVGVRGGVLMWQVGRHRGCLGEAETVPDPRGGHRLHELVHQVGRDRGAAVAERADAGGVDEGELRLLDRQPVDRRDRGQYRDPFVLNGSQELLDVEGGHDHRGAVQRSEHEQLAIAAGDVEQRDGDQGAQAGLAAQTQASDARLDVGQEVLVRGHRPLG